MDLDDTFLRLRLADGRELAVPLAWYSKLSIRGMLIGNTAA